MQIHACKSQHIYTNSEPEQRLTDWQATMASEKVYTMDIWQSEGFPSEIEHPQDPGEETDHYNLDN